MIPGEFLTGDDPIECNAGSTRTRLAVLNTGDRPIQIGSHFHFAEINNAVHFDRQAAYGKRLDIPAGTAVRLEPGDQRTVDLIDLGGTREVYGLNNAVNGPLDA